MVGVSSEEVALVKHLRGYAERYSALRSAVAPHLAATVECDNSVFTSHGYDHCVRILQRLNSCLGEEYYRDVSSEETFFLCVAALLHDFVMTRDVRQRYRHSAEARRVIKEEIERLKDGPFGIVAAPFKSREAGIVGDIVYAHSDIKDEADYSKVAVRTLDEVSTEVNQGESGNIRTGVLGALLRFGDELDCTADRCEDAQGLVNEEIRKSNPHWRKCELVLEVTSPKVARTEIVLKLNETTIAMRADVRNDAELVHEVVTKLQGSLDEVDRVFEANAISWWHYTTVSVKAPKDPKVRDAILRSGDSTSRLVAGRETPGDVEGAGVGMVEGSTIVGSAARETSVARLLRSWVHDYGLLLDGHFEISKERHARDWIDTSRLLEERKFLSQIVSCLLPMVKGVAEDVDGVFLLGEGFPGLILASQIGFLTGFPCGYVVPPREADAHSDHEKIVEIAEGTMVVVLTDVVAGGGTIGRTIEYLEATYGVKYDRISAIYSVFRRRPVGQVDQIAEHVARKLHCLNSEFDIQMCQRDPRTCELLKAGAVNLVNHVEADMWPMPDSAPTDV